MSRSLKNLYPEKYQNFLNSENYKLRSKIQQESNYQKEICKREANYICQHCGQPALDAHHIISVESGGEDTQENLVCLCRKCHQQVHKNVYTVDKETKKLIPVIYEEHKLTKKPSYISEFETLTGLTLYRGTSNYYAFVDNVKTFFTVAEIKEAVNYTPKAKTRNEHYHEVAKMKKYVSEKSKNMIWSQGKLIRKFVRLYDEADYEILKELYEAMGGK